jgi:hypothetical protein
MRLWSLHPKYLDPQGLVALWREALLAQAVLRGKTKGYKHHPQLERFSSHASPRLAINAYLGSIYEEAASRGYEFDRRKIGPIRAVTRISVPGGQLRHEWKHLLQKLSVRSPALYSRWRIVSKPTHHPLFRIRQGAKASWERGSISPDKVQGRVRRGRVTRPNR